MDWQEEFSKTICAALKENSVLGSEAHVRRIEITEELEEVTCLKIDLILNAAARNALKIYADRNSDAQAVVG